MFFVSVSAAVQTQTHHVTLFPTVSTLWEHSKICKLCLENGLPFFLRIHFESTLSRIWITSTCHRFMESLLHFKACICWCTFFKMVAGTLTFNESLSFSCFPRMLKNPSCTVVSVKKVILTGWKEYRYFILSHWVHGILLAHKSLYRLLSL